MHVSVPKMKRKKIDQISLIFSSNKLWMVSWKSPNTEKIRFCLRLQQIQAFYCLLRKVGLKLDYRSQPKTF